MSWFKQKQQSGSEPQAARHTKKMIVVETREAAIRDEQQAAAFRVALENERRKVASLEEKLAKSAMLRDSLDRVTDERDRLYNRLIGLELQIDYYFESFEEGLTRDRALRRWNAFAPPPLNDLTEDDEELDRVQGKA